MRITITAMLAIGLLGLSFHATAVTAIPDRGLTQDAVRAQFGAPKRQVAPVGTPPISRWIYDDFTVYFEGNFTIHSVSHARTLTTPPPAQAEPQPSTPAPAAETVDALPKIDEIDATATPVETTVEATPATETPAVQAPAAEESNFRFDPTTGRIIEVGADGKTVRSPTAQPAAAEPRQPPEPIESKIAPAPEPVRTPAPAPEPAPAAPAVPTPEPEPAAVAPATPAATGNSFRFDPVSGRMVEVDSTGNIIPADTPKAVDAAPAAPSTPKVEAPAPAPAPAPASPSAPAQPSASEAPAEPASQFRFDPATGRIVMQEPEQKAEQKTEQAPSQPATPATATEAPAQTPSSGGEEEAGFRLQW